MSGSQEEAVWIRVNGRRRPLRSANLSALLAELECGERGGIAVAVNGAVIPRSEWSAQRLAAGDDVEIVGAVQGG